MKIDILTLFPNSFAPLEESIIGKARERNKIDLKITDIRNFSQDKHKKCDDTPYGGGEGMVMTPQPLCDSISSVLSKNSYVIYFSPKGKKLTQKKVEELALKNHIVLICGHYEGIDQRIIDKFVDEEISIGDYVLTGGELPAMVLVDSVSRLQQGVLHNENSSQNETFADNLLEYPQYTKPENFNGFKVPEILLSGNHKEIDEWRLNQSLELTKKRRPDLISENVSFKQLDKSFAKEIMVLTNTTFVQCESKFYEDQAPLKLFVRGDSKKFVENSFDSCFYFGAIFNNKLVGFLRCSLEKQKIQSFFVDTNFQGLGIGKQLLEMTEMFFKEKGIQKIVADSSLFAVNVYEKLGFKIVGKQQETQQGIKFVPMEKVI